MSQNIKRRINTISLVVDDYDRGIDFYVNKMGFVLIEDTPIPEQDKRWVLIAPDRDAPLRLLLAQAASPKQAGFIGNQAGGRVFLFLTTDDFWRDYKLYIGAGIEFVREPVEETYGIVAVFRDIYGNLWDLIQPA